MRHLEYIKSKIDNVIREKGIIHVGNNLNKYISFDEANQYAEDYAKNFYRKDTIDKSRQDKSSKDSILGKLVEEIIVYLLDNYFKENKLDYLISNGKNEKFATLLGIEKRNTNLKKFFDVDIIIHKTNLQNDNMQKFFCLSAKGTTRERIGQFLSHLFLMDQKVLDAKYGNNRYEVIFHKNNVKIKYGFITFDWAKSKDFAKYSITGKKRKTTKETEVHLILDDHRIGGGIYVLNNHENIEGIGNFASLCGRIADFLN